MDSTPFSPAALPTDTKAVLLLCGTFAKEKGSTAKPLTPGEYNNVALWLNHRGKRPAALLQHPEELLSQADQGLPSVERLRALLDRGVQMSIAVESWHNLGLWIVSRAEDRYPERLRRLRSAAPPLLYGAGDISLLDRGGLAVVGSRSPSEDALDFTQRVAERCAAQDVQILSGGARGVDQVSVAAALENGGSAVAVLADHLDRAATSRDAKEALRGGRLALLSPYKPEASFTVGNAMGRNKHIYALADAALVVHFKTGEGGTWAGAVERLRQNKPNSPGIPVFVRVQHNPEDGIMELQRKGARLFPEEDFFKGKFVELLKPEDIPSEQHQIVPQDNSPQDIPSEQHQIVPQDNSPLLPSVADENSSRPIEAETMSPPSSIAPSPPEAEEISNLVEADTCYHRCLPLLVQNLQQQTSKTKCNKEIAKRLELMPKQLEKWLERAVVDKKVIKKTAKGNKTFYIAASAVEQTLFARDG